MSNGELLAQLNDMRQAAATIGACANRISDAIEAIDTEVRSIGPDRFTSIAAEDFRAEFNRMTPRLREAFQQLIVFQNKLNESADDIEIASRPTS